MLFKTASYCALGCSSSNITIQSQQREKISPKGKADHSEFALSKLRKCNEEVPLKYKLSLMLLVKLLRSNRNRHKCDHLDIQLFLLSGETSKKADVSVCSPFDLIVNIGETVEILKRSHL